MKHRLSCTLLVVLVWASTILSACTATATPTPEPAPATDTPIVSTVTDTPAPPPTPTSTQATGPTQTPAPDGLPDMPVKPQPQSSTFQGCPPEGDGGDTQLNALKNRIDEGSFVPVTFDALISLTWPKTTEQRHMDQWSAADAAAIAKYEGIPVVVQGYIYGARQSGAESANCHGTTSDMTDWHIWFTKTAGEDRTHSIVVETTPRIRPLHKWTLSLMSQIALGQTPVRISGWVFFDPEHPDQLLKTRGTLWEIHPVMQIEVLQNGQWIPLDNLAP